MDKNEAQRELRRLLDALNQNKALLNTTLTRIFDLEAKIRKLKAGLNDSQPTKIPNRTNKIRRPSVVLSTLPQDAKRCN
jgi:DNA repair ATPase RecN